MNIEQVVDIFESEFALKPRVFGQILEEDGNVRVNLSAVLDRVLPIPGTLDKTEVRQELRLMRIFSQSAQNEHAFRLMAGEFRRAIHEAILADADVKLEPRK